MNEVKRFADRLNNCADKKCDRCDHYISRLQGEDCKRDLIATTGAMIRDYVAKTEDDCK